MKHFLHSYYSNAGEEQLVNCGDWGRPTKTKKFKNQIAKKMSIIVIVSFAIFFCLHFLCSQVIYSKNYFTLLFIITLSLPFIFLLFLKNGKMLVIINTGLLCFYYSLFLFLIKNVYKKINKKFIQKGLINVEYSNKDFTYVLWDGDIPTVGNWWNEKLASKPSWLDHLFTYLLIIIPILFFWIVNFFDKGG